MNTVNKIKKSCNIIQKSEFEIINILKKSNLNARKILISKILESNNINLIYEVFCESDFLIEEEKDSIIKKVCEIEDINILIYFSEYVDWLTSNNKLDLFNKVYEIGNYKQLHYYLNSIMWLDDNQVKLLKEKLDDMKDNIVYTYNPNAINNK